jgi:hypothetical protein
MSSKPKGNGSTESQATSVQVVSEEGSSGNSARNEKIKRRAYEIYLERGEQPGRELDDWLQAERELARGVLARAGRLGSRSVTHADQEMKRHCSRGTRRYAAGCSICVPSTRSVTSTLPRVAFA